MAKYGNRYFFRGCYFFLNDVNIYYDYFLAYPVQKIVQLYTHALLAERKLIPDNVRLLLVHNCESAIQYY